MLLFLLFSIIRFSDRTLLDDLNDFIFILQDLSLVVNFTVPRSKDSVNTRLILEMSDEIIKLK